MTQQTDEEQEVFELANEVFSKCFLVLLAHVQRKLNLDPDYEEPRFLRALMVTFETLQKDEKKLKEGQVVSGVSVNDDPPEGYMVLFKKRGKGYEFFKVIDIVRDREVGIPEVMRLIQVSILLDNVQGEEIEWGRAMDLLKRCIPEVNFVRFPVNQWKKYRDKLCADIWQQRIPQLNPYSPEVSRLNQAKSFGDVPQVLRSYMASMYAHDKYPGGKTMGISSPNNSIQKYKIMNMVAEVLYGKSGDFIRKPGVQASTGKKMGSSQQ